MGEMRIEKDTMGELEVPVDRYYGCQTARSLLNFDIGGDTMPVGVVRAFGILKQAAAKTNVALEQLDPEVGDLVIAAAQEVIDGHLND
ncbi:lyase family protein, partial [Candidatus Poseidonia alphae]|nr:lyase family protein [Candidatus Poseidonia alphae]